MSGKSLAVTFGAGVLTGVILFLYDVTIGPQIQKAVVSATSSVTA